MSLLIYKEGDHVSGGGYWLEGVTRKVRMKLSPLSVVCRLLLSVLLRSRTTRKMVHLSLRLVGVIYQQHQNGTN